MANLLANEYAGGVDWEEASAPRRYTVNRCTMWAALVAITVAAAATAQDKPPAAADPSNMLAQMQQQFMKQFDVDKDGKLNPQEQMLAQEVMRRQGINLGIAPSGFPGADQFQKMFDRDGDG